MSKVIEADFDRIRINYLSGISVSVIWGSLSNSDRGRYSAEVAMMYGGTVFGVLGYRNMYEVAEYIYKASRMTGSQAQEMITSEHKEHEDLCD